MNLSIHPSLWRLALRRTLPVAMGYYPAGMAFGVLMAAAGLPLWLCLLLSVTVYSGAAQYAAIPLLASGAGIATLTISTFVINLRHIFYGIPLLNAAPAKVGQRLYAFFALTDESFSVLTTLPEVERKPLFVRIVFLNQCYWVSASLIGFVVGGIIGQAVAHLDFALVCLFVMLWYEQLRDKRILWSSVAAFAAFCLAKTVTADYVLLLAVALCALMIVMRAAHPALQRSGTVRTQWLLAVLAVGGALSLLLWLPIRPEARLADAIGSPLAAGWQVVAVLCMAAVTFALRFAPNLLPRSGFDSPYLRALNQALPLSVMTILMMAGVDIDGALHGLPLMLAAQVLALCAVWWVYRQWRHVFFGMVTGVVLLNGLLWWWT